MTSAFLTKATKWAVLFGAKRIPLVRRLAEFIHSHTSNQLTYPYAKKCFLRNGSKGPIDTEQRREIVRRFEKIDENITSFTTATDGLILAEAMISSMAPGEIVECGCFSGASSAKLSILADFLDRKLTVFDSFEGLPSSETDYRTRSGSKREKITWDRGQYAAGIDDVRRNIEGYGAPERCTLVKGWFSDTLVDANLPERIAFAFTDVDLASSVRDCLVSLWPRIVNGGIFASHDVAFIGVLQQFYDQELWTNQIGSFPPVLFGAGYGVCEESPHLGYAVKGRMPSVFYRDITLDKNQGA